MTRELPMSWPVAHAAFVAHAEARPVEPAASAVLGIDETRRGRLAGPRTTTARGTARRGSRPTSWTCPALVGRSARAPAAAPKTVTDWLDARGQGWKNAVQVMTIDPCAAYRTAVERALPHATIVADHFHLVRVRHEAPCVASGGERPPPGAVAAVRRS